MSVELNSLLRTEGETLSFGRHVGSILEPGDWVALTGELGSGKTTLVSGVLASLHPGARVRSPTYVLVEVYGSNPVVVHADLFRLRSSGEYACLGLEDLENEVHQPTKILETTIAYEPFTVCLIHELRVGITRDLDKADHLIIT